MDSKVNSQGYGFATFPSVKLKGFKINPKTKKRKFGFKKELLFGDYIKPYKKGGNIIEKTINGKTYIYVRARGADGYILNDEIQPNRVLEVNFVDLGQGDGCHVVTPDDKHIIIDAGKGDNMYRYLSWRFNLRNSKNTPPTFTGIISHSDDDHYGGFSKLFTKQKDGSKLFSFDTIYHNGMVEESGKPYRKLGEIISDDKGEKFVTKLVKTNADFINRSSSAQKPGNYIKLLRKTSAQKKSLQYGDSPIIESGNIKIEVLGPVTQKVEGQDALPVFDSNKGRTKNGHSIILKLTIGKLKLLLGGDLNSSSEKYLFKCFADIDIDSTLEVINDPEASTSDRKKAQSEFDSAMKKLKKLFQVDIAKSCHHGSADFTNEFLEVINPIATVISSGDNEPHCHPRPDTLGTIGKYSRGNRSLIFSTELARSGKEFINLSNYSAFKRKERLVTVYGMINVRTDGENTIVAQKLEQPRASQNWDINILKWNKKTEEFEYVKTSGH